MLAVLLLSLLPVKVQVVEVRLLVQLVDLSQQTLAQLVQVELNVLVDQLS